MSLPVDLLPRDELALAGALVPQAQEQGDPGGYHSWGGKEPREDAEIQGDPTRMLKLGGPHQDARGQGTPTRMLKRGDPFGMPEAGRGRGAPTAWGAARGRQGRTALAPPSPRPLQRWCCRGS